jgi:hypothetical protein
MKGYPYSADIPGRAYRAVFRASIQYVDVYFGSVEKCIVLWDITQYNYGDPVARWRVRRLKTEIFMPAAG